MKPIILLPLLLLFLFACQRKNKPTTIVKDQNCLFRNVIVVNLQDSSLLEQQDIWIKEGKIAAIGPSNSLNTGRIQQVDGQGQYVMMGLSDMHVHLPSDSLERQCFLLQHLLAGVTYVRSMRGEANHIPLRQAIQKGEYIGPDLYLASQPIRKNLEMTPEEVDALVKEFKTIGYDAIKILSVADSVTFQALVTASKKYALPLCGHVSSNIGLTETLKSEQYTSIEHLGGYFRVYAKGEAAIKEGLNATAQAGVYNCATLDFYTASTRDLATLQQQAGLKYVSEQQKEAWKTTFSERQKDKTAEEKVTALKRANNYKQVRLILLKALYDFEAPLLASPDATGIFAVPGFSLLRELKLHEEAGIPCVEVLKIATHNAAQFVGEEQYGGLKQGQKANFIVLGANPLENLDHLSSIKGVYCNGHWHSKEHLEKQLATLSPQ